MLEARQLVKQYPGVLALDHVDFSVNPGEVVGLIGENGAGKSSLIKVLAGLSTPDQGEIRVDGKSVVFSGVADSVRAGIGVIHQELSNLSNIDVAGNIFLGREPRKWGMIDQRQLRKRAAEILAPLGVSFSPDTLVSQLSIAEQQLVEIAKALSLDSRFLIMDEPTSSLTLSETETLMRIVQDLRRRGVGVVYVSHRLDEVIELADRVIAMRDGRNAGGLRSEEISTEAMIRMMVGRDVTNHYVVREQSDKDRLILKDLCTTRFPQHAVNLNVRRGEILGVAGLVGAGRTELVRAVFGVDKASSGTVELDGQQIHLGSPKTAINNGILLAPEDRRTQGLVTSMSVKENVSLPSLELTSRFGLVNSAGEAIAARAMKEALNIKAPTVESIVSGLSGGNQQKVVLGKWLNMNPKVLILDEPTRGIDVGARSEIYLLMRKLADDGVSIIMVSSDMEEILALSDRVAVMREGRLAALLPREEATQEAIMRFAVTNA